MDLKLYRFHASNEDTIGMLFVDGIFGCFTLEDQKQTVKVPSETRIPVGRYRIFLRTEGKHHIQYAAKFPAIHKGMLHLQNVPGFEYILIHIGNTDKDTQGCLLIGDDVRYNALGASRIENSQQAYIRIYPIIAQAIIADSAWIEIVDAIPGVNNV